MSSCVSNFRGISDNIVVIEKILRNQMVIPDWDNFCRKIEEIYYVCEDVKEGKVPATSVR